MNETIDENTNEEEEKNKYFYEKEKSKYFYATIIMITMIVAISSVSIAYMFLNYSDNNVEDIAGNDNYDNVEQQSNATNDDNDDNTDNIDERSSNDVDYRFTYQDNEVITWFANTVVETDKDYYNLLSIYASSYDYSKVESMAREHKNEVLLWQETLSSYTTSPDFSEIRYHMEKILNYDYLASKYLLIGTESLDADYINLASEYIKKFTSETEILTDLISDWRNNHMVY